MARRTDGSVADPTSQETPEATEAQATPTPDGTTEAQATPETPATPAVDFAPVVEAAIAQRDTTTGDLPADALESVKTAYKAQDGVAHKNAAKKILTEGAREAMLKLDVALAKAYVLLQDACASTSATSTPRPPADPKEAFRLTYGSLALALHLVSQKVPEGVDVASIQITTDDVSNAATYESWLTRSDERKDETEPDVSPVVKQAVRLITGKGGIRKTGGSSGPRSTERHDIGKHIEAAFAEATPGQFLTVADIVNHKSTEYGDEKPSAGAVSARLFPRSGKCTVAGITPGMDGGKKGARKDAA